MRSINEFMELLDHEFSECDIKLKDSGFKMDGHGKNDNGSYKSLKIHCQFNELKSVDYIYPKNGEFFLLEFSDIGSQQNSIFADIENIKCSNIDNSLKRDLIRERHRVVHNELKIKFTDSIHIIRNIHTYLTDIPDGLQNSPHKYLIIIAPFHPAIPEVRKIQINKFLQDIKSKIIQAIPDNLFAGVAVIPIEEFANKV